VARSHKNPKRQKALRIARSTGRYPRYLFDPLWTQVPGSGKEMGNKTRNPYPPQHKRP